MSQIFLLTGENEYELRMERKRWISEFATKHGEENLSHLDAAKVRIPELIGEIAAAPFIAEKRLVVIDGIPKMEKEQIQEISNAMHPANLLLFVEAKPDKRLSATKELLKTATVKTFSCHTGAKLASWLASIAVKEGAKLSESASRHLVRTVGENQMLLSTELQKLIAYADGNDISTQDIDTLCMLSEQQAAWKLTDLLAAGKTQEALMFVRSLIQKGESPYAVWNILLWIISQFTLVVAAVQEGQTSPAAITKLSGASFPTARAFASVAKRADTTVVRKIIESYSQTDVELKTGGYRSTVDAPEELLSLIDCHIAKVASL